MVDLAVKLLRAGYDALPDERLRHAAADPFVTRLLGRRTVVVRGREGAALFYDESVVRRRGAIPLPVRTLLFGRGAVHGLDDGAHRARKAMFLEALGDDRTAALVADIGVRLRSGVAPGEMRVFPTLVSVYAAAVLAWSGVDVDPAEAEHRARDLATIVHGFGNDAPARLRARRARWRVERWAREEVRRARERSSPPPGSPLAVLANGAGAELDLRTAAVELVNVLRPTVAVAWPATYAALALAQHPEWREALHDPQADRLRRSFAHEARRLFPFAPALAGRVRRSARLSGVELRPGDRIVLDVPGTNTDERLWEAATRFLPGRHVDGEPAPFDLVAQGGGDPQTGHRCPGEPLTVAVLAETARWLAGHELRLLSAPALPRARIPTLPEGGLRLSLR